MPKRTVAFLVLKGDERVQQVVDGIKARPELFELRAEEQFAARGNRGDADLVDAIGRLESIEFDTLVLITHGYQPSPVTPGEVEHYVQTADSGPFAKTHWYELAQYLAPLLNGERAFVALCCFSSQEEFREAMIPNLSAFTVAALCRITVHQAIEGTLEFFRVTQPFVVGDMLHALQPAGIDSLNERISDASKGHMVGWVPGSDCSALLAQLAIRLNPPSID